MGLFDYIRFNGHEYQTKDTNSQSIANYKIEVDQESGLTKLWHEEYTANWVETADDYFGGHLEKTDLHWVCCNKFTGEIKFYRMIDYDSCKFEEYSAYFHKGILKEIHLLGED